MNVGIVGIGLIGGSMAKAYSEGGHTVYAFDTDDSILDYAIMTGVVSGVLDKKTFKKCDIILIAVSPKACIEYINKNAADFPKGILVIDCCGTKKNVCECGFAAALKYGFTFVGGHPMAGTQYSGFKNSKANMFRGAPMVIVPPEFDNIELLDKIKTLLKPCGFGKINITTAIKHDEMIAFTSQMAHVVSNAYIKSPTARLHKGFSAGSYKDMTRVAWLNEKMWTELFSENREFLIREIDYLSDELKKYRDALADSDENRLMNLLREGRQRKEEIDG